MNLVPLGAAAEEQWRNLVDYYRTVRANRSDLEHNDTIAALKFESLMSFFDDQKWLNESPSKYTQPAEIDCDRLIHSTVQVCRRKNECFAKIGYENFILLQVKFRVFIFHVQFPEN